MNFPELRKNAAWLLPGLFIKRWLIIGVAGLLIMSIGAALLLNMQPVAYVIRTLEHIALTVPASASGSLLMLLGALLLFLGSSRIYNNFLSVMREDGFDSDFLEAMYRKRKLAKGPRIVAVGGGTGLSTLLRGLKDYTSNITAIVTVGDDGGSSGRLRTEQGIIPPGDIRNCIAALSDEEQMITELFQYRFRSGPGLEGHSFGNLFLTAMCQITGDMVSAIKESSKVLKIRGRVLPSTLDNVHLVAEMEDGSIVEGESNIPEARGKIKRLSCNPAQPTPLPEVLDAIENAELIILGPGSLYTSVIPNLLIEPIAKAIAAKNVAKLYVSNIMTQPGETDGYSVSDHLRAIIDHVNGEDIVNGVIVNTELPEALLDKYKNAGYDLVNCDTEQCNALNVDVVTRLLVDEKDDVVIRHDSRHLARAIIKWYRYDYLKEHGKETMGEHETPMRIVKESPKVVDAQAKPTSRVNSK